MKFDIKHWCKFLSIAMVGNLLGHLQNEKNRFILISLFRILNYTKYIFTTFQSMSMSPATKYLFNDVSFKLIKEITTSNSTGKSRQCFVLFKWLSFKLITCTNKQKNPVWCGKILTLILFNLFTISATDLCHYRPRHLVLYIILSSSKYMFKHVSVFTISDITSWILFIHPLLCVCVYIYIYIYIRFGIKSNGKRKGRQCRKLIDIFYHKDGSIRN